MQCKKCGNKAFHVLKQQLSPPTENLRADWLLLWACDGCLEPYFTEETWDEYIRKYRSERISK